jgi:hypothetical protein
VVRTSSVYDLFHAALRRSREDMIHPGALIRDEDGAVVCFSISSDSGVVMRAEFRCTTCATLVAVCELLRVRSVGMHVDTIAQWRVSDVVAWLPGIPESRWPRIALALRALQS